MSPIAHRLLGIVRIGLILILLANAIDPVSVAAHSNNLDANRSNKTRQTLCPNSHRNMPRPLRLSRPFEPTRSPTSLNQRSPRTSSPTE